MRKDKKRRAPRLIRPAKYIGFKPASLEEHRNIIATIASRNGGTLSTIELCYVVQILEELWLPPAELRARKRQHLLDSFEREIEIAKQNGEPDPEAVVAKATGQFSSANNPVAAFKKWLWRAQRERDKHSA